MCQTDGEPNHALDRARVHSQLMKKNILFFYRFKDELLIDFSLTVKAATLIFISGRGSAISSGTQEKSGSI